MYKLVAVKTTQFGPRCGKCRHPHRPVTHVFMGVETKRWHRRCRPCCERMVRDGKAFFNQ